MMIVRWIVGRVLLVGIVLSFFSFFGCTTSRTVLIAGEPVLDPFVVETVQTLDTIVILTQQVLAVVLQGVETGTLPVSLGRRAYAASGVVQEAVVQATHLLVGYVAMSQQNQQPIRAAVMQAQRALQALIALAQERT